MPKVIIEVKDLNKIGYHEEKRGGTVIARFCFNKEFAVEAICPSGIIEKDFGPIELSRPSSNVNRVVITNLVSIKRESNSLIIKGDIDIEVKSMTDIKELDRPEKVNEVLQVEEDITISMPAKKRTIVVEVKPTVSKRRIKSKK